MNRLELARLEREMEHIGLFGKVPPGSTGYSALSWRDSVATARVRTATRGRRFKVWGYKMFNPDGSHVWCYQYGPYAVGTPRAMGQRGCTTCGLVGRSRVQCEAPYHSKPIAMKDYIELYGEVGTLEVAGTKTTVRISAE